MSIAKSVNMTAKVDETGGTRISLISIQQYRLCQKYRRR